MLTTCTTPPTQLPLLGCAGKPGAGKCYSCHLCGSTPSACIDCNKCIVCEKNPPPPPPPAPPAPAAWTKRVQEGQLLMTSDYAAMPGLYPSVGNGFISANVGCVPGAAAFPLHMGGVFNNVLRVHPKKTLSIPHRARDNSTATTLPTQFAHSRTEMGCFQGRT